MSVSLSVYMHAQLLLYTLSLSFSLYLVETREKREREISLNWPDRHNQVVDPVCGQCGLEMPSERANNNKSMCALYDSPIGPVSE